MEATYEDDQIVEDAIEKAIREPPNEGPTCVAMDHWATLGIGNNNVNRATGVCEEFVPESAALALIPSIDRFEVRRGRCTEYVLLHRARARI